MKIKTTIRAGQQSITEAPVEYARTVVDELVNAAQDGTKNLRLWSIVGLKGDGYSNWMVIRQNPTKTA